MCINWCSSGLITNAISVCCSDIMQPESGLCVVSEKRNFFLKEAKFYNSDGIILQYEQRHKKR